MICPKCRRETATIMAPQFICTECLLKGQRKKIESLEQIIDNLEAQAVLCEAWAHIPKEEWDANMELWKKYVASRQ